MRKTVSLTFSLYSLKLYSYFSIDYFVGIYGFEEYPVYRKVTVCICSVNSLQIWFLVKQFQSYSLQHIPVQFLAEQCLQIAVPMVSLHQSTAQKYMGNIAMVDASVIATSHFTFQL